MEGCRCGEGGFHGFEGCIEVRNGRNSNDSVASKRK